MAEVEGDPMHPVCIINGIKTDEYIVSKLKKNEGTIFGPSWKKLIHIQSGEVDNLALYISNFNNLKFKF